MQRLCLIIIDGFGVAPPGPGNARSLAKLPTIHRLEQEVPNVLMAASGNAVGLPEGQQGASEPGHLTLGAGRIVWQPLEEINIAVRSGAFFKNKVLTGACKRAEKNKTPLHVVGLYSVGGVHSHVEHFFAFLKLASSYKISQIFLHLIADGRDVAEQQFCKDFALLDAEIKKYPSVKIASLIGRYYAMDRDRQFVTRTKLAYDLLTQGIGGQCNDVCTGAQEWYAKAPDKQKTDYYIQPLKTPDFQAIAPEDTVVCINFRADRMAQIVSALADEQFTEFPRPTFVNDVVCTGPYSYHLPVAFPPAKVKNTLGEVISKAGLKQLRIAETDKMPHLTFFFNAQVHEPFPGEDRILVESPKVPNYADTPDMSADELTDRMIEQVKKGQYDFIAMNFANPDLVGHGGKLDAEIRACEAVDRNLARFLPVLEQAGYDWIVTADHGNAEEMYYPGTTTICPSHSSNPVQTFVHSSLVTSSKDIQGLTGLKDIAPLCLKIMGLPIPKEMQS